MKKIIIIWTALMLAIMLIVNTGCLVVLGVFNHTMMPAMKGYTKNADKLLYPYDYAQTIEDSEKTATVMSAVCTLRRLFNNENLSADPDKSWKVFLAQKFNVDQSIRFTEKDGNSALLSGIWTTAYDTSAESTFKSQKGLIDLKRLCETEESKALYKIIEENRNAEIQLNSYIQKKEIIIPVSVTVRDTAGNVLLETEFPYSNEDGELINSENINILNEEVKDGGFSTGDLYISMKSAYQGERKVDRIAASLAENIEYGSGDDTKNSFGFASLTSSMVETAEDYGMIVVFKYSCIEMFIAWTVLLGLIMTGVMTLVVLLKKKKENEGF